MTENGLTVPSRVRRSCLSVPGADERKLAKCVDVPVDELIFDLEDSVALNCKREARRLVSDAISSGGFRAKTISVRVNEPRSPFMYRDIIDLVSDASSSLDCLVIPKVEHPGQVWFVDILLTQLEADLEVKGRIGLEVLIESATGSVNLKEIASVRGRIEAIVFGPGDYAASQGSPQMGIGTIERGYSGHQWHSIMSNIVSHARMVDAQPIDGPYGNFKDFSGLRESATIARQLGMDGKWCIHPGQVDIVNDVFTPTQREFDRACELLGALERASEEGKGTLSVGGGMVDEASRKMAARVVALGEAAELGRR